MENKEIALRDWFAGQALAAMIAKFPMIDKLGVYGREQTREEIDQIKADLSDSAYGYADAMLARRKEYPDAQ